LTLYCHNKNVRDTVNRQGLQNTQLLAKSKPVLGVAVVKIVNNS